MTVKALYDDVVKQISDIDKSIEYLKGKRESLSGIRLDLYDMLLNEKPFDELMAKYCKEHHMVIVDEDVWADAEKALNHFNDIKADIEKWRLGHEQTEVHN